MVRIPPAVYEHHLIRGFPRLEGCVLYNDARLPLPIAPAIAAEVNAFCAAALVLGAPPELEQDVKAFKRTVELMVDCFTTSNESTRCTHEMQSSITELEARLDLLQARGSELNARLDRLERAERTLTFLQRDRATNAGGEVPKGVPLDEARCYSYLCTEGETCYAPRCPRGREQPGQPRGSIQSYNAP